MVVLSRRHAYVTAQTASMIGHTGRMSLSVPCLPYLYPMMESAKNAATNRSIPPQRHHLQLYSATTSSLLRIAVSNHATKPLYKKIFGTSNNFQPHGHGYIILRDLLDREFLDPTVAESLLTRYVVVYQTQNPMTNSKSICSASSQTWGCYGKLSR